MKKRLLLILVTGFLHFTWTGCYKESDYDSSQRGLDSLFTLSASRNSVAADGVSALKITVGGLPQDMTDTDNKILLTTDAGLFDQSNGKTAALPSNLVYINGQLARQLTINLISESKVDSVHLAATVKGVTKALTLYFYRALPDRMRIIPAAVFLKSSLTTGTAIEVDLLRDTGTVSQQTRIALTVTNDKGDMVGIFQLYNNLSDSMGKCQFNYFFPDSVYTGNLKIKASLDGYSSTLSDSVNLTIYK
jgi:hypothetical protein